MVLRRTQLTAQSTALGLFWWCFHTALFISSFFTLLTCENHCEHYRVLCVQRLYLKYLPYGNYSINISYYNSHPTNVLIYSPFISQKLDFSFKNIGIHLTSNHAKHILIFLVYFRWNSLENYSISRPFLLTNTCQYLLHFWRMSIMVLQNLSEG